MHYAFMPTGIRTTSDQSSDHGSLHSLCSRVPKRFRSLHTLLGTHRCACAHCTGTQTHWLSKSVNSFASTLCQQLIQQLGHSLVVTSRDSPVIWGVPKSHVQHSQQGSNHQASTSCAFTLSCVSHQLTTLSYLEDLFDVSCSSSDFLDIRTCCLELLE